MVILLLVKSFLIYAGRHWLHMYLGLVLLLTALHKDQLTVKLFVPAGRRLPKLTGFRVDARGPILDVDLVRLHG
jgi:hypothetical protein